MAYDRSDIGSHSSLWKTVPSTLSNTVEYDVSRLAFLDAKGKFVDIDLSAPGKTLPEGGVACLTHWGLPPASCEFMNLSTPETVAQLDDKDTGLPLSSLISGPFTLGPSRYGDSFVVAAGTERELKFTAHTTALAKFYNKQAQLENDLQQALNGEVSKDDVSTADTVFDGKPLTAAQGAAIRQAYSDLLAHQECWYFKSDRQAKSLEEEAENKYNTLESLWMARGGTFKTNFPEIRAAAPNFSKASDSKHIWTNIILIVMLVSASPDKLAPEKRKTLAEIVEIGQQLNRIYMDGYVYRYHPMFTNPVQ
jgi:hypothetical protein